MKKQVSPYMNLNRIEFITTYQCNGNCKHCSVGPRLNRPGGHTHVKPEAAVRAVEELADLFDIGSVMTFGGEPLLYPDSVCAVHQAAVKCGIPTRQLITNGYFTKDDARSRQVAQDLAHSGLNSLLLSVDAFHQETIPLRPVHDFARYAAETGVETVKLSPAWVVNERHDNAYNRQTREILQAFDDLGLPVSRGNDIFLSGNAAVHLAEFYEQKPVDLSLGCGTMPYTEPLTDVTSLTVKPNGDVAICGFVLGNLYAGDSMADIVARYDPYKNRCMHALVTGGMEALLAHAAGLGVQVNTADYHSVCDICHAIMARVPSHALSQAT